MYWSLLFFGLVMGLFLWVFHQYQDRIFKWIESIERVWENLKRYRVITGIAIVVVIICYSVGRIFDLLSNSALLTSCESGFRVWMG